MPIRFLLKTTIQFPYVLGKSVVSIFVPKGKSQRRPTTSLPVLGLDETRAQSILISLREENIDGEVKEAWLTALQLAQIVTDRLLKDLHNVHQNLTYWESSMRSGHHGWRMFIQRGPIQALQKAIHLITGSSDDSPATKMIEERVVCLRGLEKAISKALGSINEATVYLHMDDKHAPAWLPHGLPRDKRAYIHVRVCLALISDALRRLRLEALPVDDPVQSTQSMSLSRQSTLSRMASFDFRSDHNTQLDDQDMAVLNELIAKISDRLQVDVQRPISQPVHEVLQRTQWLSDEAPPLVSVPSWVQYPSKYQRHWIRYSLYFLMCTSILKFLYVHSPLSGSDDMQRWIISARFAMDEHVVGPLNNLVQEVFDTFHGTPSIVSREDYELSKDSLLRMLKDFEADIPKQVQVESKKTAEQEKSMIEGMDTLMRTYESELKNPVKNVLTGGRLARALLIQVQKLKVDTESAMLQLDQILRANELNVAFVAAIPSLFIAGGVVYLLFNTAFRTGPDPLQSLIPCRLALIELQRALSVCKEDESAGVEEYGKMLYRLQRTYKICWNVFKTSNTNSQRSEWPSLRRDFIDLARPLSLNQKHTTCERMRVTYSVFQV